jgi:hypothetical protein
MLLKNRLSLKASFIGVRQALRAAGILTISFRMIKADGSTSNNLFGLRSCMAHKRIRNLPAPRFHAWVYKVVNNVTTEQRNLV